MLLGWRLQKGYSGWTVERAEQKIIVSYEITMKRPAIVFMKYRWDAGGRSKVASNVYLC